MTSFIIHIGPHKTGSTYLQNHLTGNRAALIGRGILYPREWTTPEIPWCHAELPKLLQRDDYASVERTFAGLKSVGWPTVVLSSEDLSSLGEDRLRFVRECTGTDVEIVFFARRWSELLQSHSQEHIRQGGTKPLPEFIAPILANPFGSEAVNFCLVLDRFANVFGLSRLKVLSYNNILQRGENLFSYFAAKVLGVDDLPVLSEKRAHTSLSIENIEVVRVLNVLHARHLPDIPWPMGRVVAAVSEHPLAHTRRAMTDSISEIPFYGLRQPFKALYDHTVAKYDQVIDKLTGDADKLLFERHRSNLHYINSNYLLDLAVSSELLDFLSELAADWQAPRHVPKGNPAAPIAVSIEFSSSGNSGPYCSTGWSAPEQGWQWAIGPEARMVLPRPEPAGNYVLTVKLRPFLAQPHLVRQRMTIEINGAALVSFEEDRTELSVKSVVFPAAVIAKGPELSISFRTPDAARPSDFGRPDTRELSFAFHSLALMPADKDRAPADGDEIEESATPSFTAAEAV